MDPPPVRVQEQMVVFAEKNAVADVGSPSRMPVLDVMNLAERWRLLAAGPHASALDRVQRDALRRLNTMIEPNGALVLFNDVRPEVPENIW